MSTTVIKNADWVIGWDEAALRHVYRRGLDVAFDGNAITFVGKGYAGKADRTIDGKDCFVLPGLIDVHSHPEHEPAYRGIREEHGLPGMYMTGLFERSQAYASSYSEGEGGLAGASAEFAYCELLKSGVTALVDISPIWNGWVDLMARSGLRSFLAPGFASARWKLENDHTLAYAWDAARGKTGFANALTLIDGLAKHPSGRLSGVVSPAQIDTCTEGLLRDAHAAARERKLPFTVHCAQAVNEVQEMLHRHGQTSIQWANSLGLLAPGTILGHALFIDSHSWIRWHSKRDLAILAESGTAVAHCPSPFVRYGHVMENLGDYLRAGVTMGIGTDVSPHNLVEEMRKAAVLGRVAARDIRAVSTADVFHAATVGGAKALQRDDLGRLASGKKADIVIVDLKHPHMMPARDPLRSFVYHAADRAVRDVFVDGQQVVAGGKVLTMDQEAAAERLTAAQAHLMSTVPQRDYLKRTADQITPLSLPLA
jgi:cytosine/adenosine deaminase-related metal-dependent hydrolase